MKQPLFEYGPQKTPARKSFLKRHPYIINIILFVITFFTCMVAGVQWKQMNPLQLENLHAGLSYAVLILTFLTAHEFGHYIASRIHKVDATLPYYIPMPIPFILNFGTFGAVIKTRSPIPTKKALFDIGAAGPIAGFIVCVVYLIIGFSTLPPIDYLYEIHPEYLTQMGGKIPEHGLHFGSTILFNAMKDVFSYPDAFVPPMNEIYHYPLLNVGWFGLFVTALNMLPIGQLDGGHITYSMFGRAHAKIARYFWGFMIALGLGGVLGMLNEFFQQEFKNLILRGFDQILSPVLEFIGSVAPWYYEGWVGWIFWALLTKFFVKLDHPPIHSNDDIGPGRRAVGWFALSILALCFSFNGIYLVE